MYIMLKKKHSGNNCDSEHFFVPNRCNIPLKTRNTIINLNYVNDTNDNCCKNLAVFQDTEGQSEPVSVGTHEFESNVQSTSDGQWYQATALLTGFKDCFVNKVSASELW